MVCKWTYEIDGWNEGYFREIGLEDLIANNFQKIGSRVQTPGAAIGRGLSEETARILGLLPGTPVGTSIIDAHAGGLGLIGCSIEGIPNDFSTKLSTTLIYGNINVLTHYLGGFRFNLRNFHLSHGRF